jgi:protein-disulfide isomerase
MKRLTTYFVLLTFVFNVNACAEQANKEAKAQAQPAVSDAKVIEYVRKVFNIPANMQVEVKNSSKSVAGMRAITIEVVSPGRKSQSQDAWITPDGKLIVGKSFDLNVDPYQDNWAKVNLANVPATGPEKADVVIVEYSDFQCPYCSRAHETVSQLLKQYDGKVRLLYKHLPLTNIHNWAEDAAVAASCVHNQNNQAFWTLADHLFTNQKTITKENVSTKVLEVAKQANLDVAKLETCMKNKSTLPLVKAQEEEAGKLGFSSTPSFIVNGRPVVGAIPLEQFKQIIDEALQAKQKS